MLWLWSHSDLYQLDITRETSVTGNNTSSVREIYWTEQTRCFIDSSSGNKYNCRSIHQSDAIVGRDGDEIENLPPESKRLLKGTLHTRDLTAEGNALFESDAFDHVRFGELLTRQFEVLRDYLHISTPKIEQMIQESLKAGALGAKINGSGGGGCIFAYAPYKAENVAEALERVGAKVHIIRVDEGVRREK